MPPDPGAESRHHELWDGAVLLRLARDAIAQRLGRDVAPTPRQGWLNDRCATFVTLTRAGRLRGCIGSVNPTRRLRADVESNARAAAFNDRRFPPVSGAELDNIRIEVSVLSRPRALAFDSHDDLVAQLRRGEDGLILSAGSRRAVFLPQVWESLSDPHDFVARLMAKGGIATLDDAQARAETFTVTSWIDPDSVSSTGHG